MQGGFPWQQLVGTLIADRYPIFNRSTQSCECLLNAVADRALLNTGLGGIDWCNAALFRQCLCIIGHCRDAVFAGDNAGNGYDISILQRLCPGAVKDRDGQHFLHCQHLKTGNVSSFEVIGGNTSDNGSFKGHFFFFLPGRRIRGIENVIAKRVIGKQILRTVKA